MPQVSRRSLSKPVQEKLFNIFINSLSKLSNPKDIQNFLYDLLGPVEQIMLAKRLGIALLLEKGYQYESIKNILKVSQETIARVNISLNYQGEGYKTVIKKILRDEKLEGIFNKIEDSTIAILPTSSLKRSLQRSRKSTRKPKSILG